MTHGVTPIGSYAPDFELPGVNGVVHHLTRYLEIYRAVAVIIMCNHCPYVRAYLERMKQLQREFEPQRATLIGINANDDRQFPDDSFEQMKRFATEHQLNFPYLRDVTQDVARTFGAEKTPQAFLIDATATVRYVGAIDDSPNDPEAVRHAYLKEAIAHLLSGSSIPSPMTPFVGCSIKWRT